MHAFGSIVAGLRFLGSLFYVYWQSKNCFPIIWMKFMFDPEDSLTIDDRYAIFELLGLMPMLDLVFL